MEHPVTMEPNLRAKDHRACSAADTSSSVAAASRIIAQCRQLACDQSFLRGRSFHSGSPVHDERPLSMAARELGQLRQSHLVSRFREEVRSRTEVTTNGRATNHTGPMDTIVDLDLHENYHHQENATHDEIQTHQSMENEFVDIQTSIPTSNDVVQNDFGQEQLHGYEDYSDSGSSEEASEQSDSPSSPSDNSAQQEEETYEQQTNLLWSRETSSSEDGEWHVMNSQEAEPQWRSGPSFSSNRNINRFSPPDDDVYGVELRELLSRRSVSNLLRSGFRESLDQLIQSYVRRQEEHDDPLDWDYQRQGMTTSLLSDAHGEDRIDEATNQSVSDTRDNQPSILPQQRHWQIELPHHHHHHSWSQQAMRHSEFDWDAIHVLRDDLTGLQRGMTSMQQMLEACMEMQMELQRSIKQEVSAALNRSLAVPAGEEGMLEDGSEWKLARKGTCCICCDRQIDSLLYRFAFGPCSSKSVQRYSGTKTDKNKNSDLIIQPPISDVTEENKQRRTDTSEINPTVGVSREHLLWTQHICQLSNHHDGTIYKNKLYWENNYLIDVTNREESK
uniref:Uncharacterized protein n=1 Tax=Oryza punctata TaxID=4537 RepID=A0A0E0K7L9_ORYPU